MAKDIGDVLPSPEQLEGDQIEDKEELVNKVLVVKDFAMRKSSYEGKPDFAIVQADLDGKLITFAAGSVITEKLIQMTREQIKSAKGINCKYIIVKGKKGRSYADLVSVKAKD